MDLANSINVFSHFCNQHQPLLFRPKQLKKSKQSPIDKQRLIKISSINRTHKGSGITFRKTIPGSKLNTHTRTHISSLPSAIRGVLEIDKLFVYVSCLPHRAHCWRPLLAAHDFTPTRTTANPEKGNRLFVFSNSVRAIE